MSFFRRFFGVLLIIAAIVGLLFSIVSLVVIWRVEPQATASLQNSLTLLGQTLETTAQGLEITQQTLKGAVGSIQALQGTVETTARTVQSSGPMLDMISNMVKEDLPQTISATQQSLQSAADSAKVIDTVLGTLSSIPFIGSSVGYTPEVPLYMSLEKVVDSIAELPNRLIEMGDSLAQTTGNLSSFESDLSLMASSIDTIETSVAQYEKVIGGYQAQIDSLNSQIMALSANLPSIMRTLALGLSVFLAWMAIAQIGLFAQGWEMVTQKDARKEEAPTEIEVEEETKATPLEPPIEEEESESPDKTPEA